MSVFTPVVPEGMEAFYNDYQFSPAVKCGDFLIISGQLGFDADERTYDIASFMLKDLGVNAIRLLTKSSFRALRSR